VLSTDPSRLKKKRKLEETFEKADDGRFLVEDLPEEENLKKFVRKRFKGATVANDQTDGRDTNNDEEVKEEREENQQRKRQKILQKNLGKGGQISAATRLKLAKEHQSKSGGAANFAASRFKTTKAQGDVKKKDSKYEPFAYVPLDPRQLNKRRRLHAHKNFKSVMGRKTTASSRKNISLKGVTKPRTQRRAEKKHRAKLANQY